MLGHKKKNKRELSSSSGDSLGGGKKKDLAGYGIVDGDEKLYQEQL